MKQLILRIGAGWLCALATCVLLSVPALAALPVTGDERGQRMGIVIAVLIGSVILIAVLAVMGGKGKKGKDSKKS